MTKFNFQSLLFALIMLLLVLTGKSGGQDSAYVSAKDGFNSAGLAAESILNTKENVMPEIQRPRTQSAAAAISRERFAGTVINFALPEPARIPAAPPAITARAALVKELKTETKLFEKDGLKRWPLASLTKLMTAVVARENFRPSQRVILSAAAVESVGSAGDFRSGEIFRAEDLINAALVISSNDAAAALSDFYGAREFLEQMKVKAAAIKMNDTVFFDPTGLSVLNQAVIADLEKLVAYIAKNHPAIFEITARPQITITELNSGQDRRLSNNNRFAGRPEFLGGKTGYLEDADGNLISLFTDAERKKQFLIIVLGASDRFEETEKLYQWAKLNF